MLGSPLALGSAVSYTFFLDPADKQLKRFILGQADPTGIVQLVFLPQLFFGDQPLNKSHTVGSEDAADVRVDRDGVAAKHEAAGRFDHVHAVQF
jgi:hypothetical protein